MMYEFPKKIDDDSVLAKNLNKVLHGLFLFRLVASPSTFEHYKKMKKEGVADMFYLSCLFVKWATECVERVKSWQSVTSDYLSEYNGSWRYYAASKRLESIRGYGGDDDDYDGEGNVIESGISDEKLSRYSVVGDLYFEDWQDIVQETKCDDLAWLKPALILRSKFDPVKEFKDIYGVKLPVYKQVIDDVTNEVKMVPMSDTERYLNHISDSVEMEDLYDFTIGVCNLVQSLCDRIKALDRKSDNVDEMKELNRLSTALLNCN